MNYYKIADMHVAIECGEKDFFEPLYAPYKINQPHQIDMSMVVRQFKKLTVPCDGAEIYSSDTKKYLLLDNGHRCLIYYSEGIPITVIEYSENYDRVNIDVLRLDNEIKPHIISEYMYCGFYFYFMLSLHGGMMLHSSVISFRGNGIAFTAPCGTGKSTQTTLWKNYFSNDVVLLNDDKPALRLIDGKFYIYGTPFSGKHYINTPGQAPLKAIIYLAQAKENVIEKVDSKQAVFYLYEQIARNINDKRVIENSLELINQLLETVPYYKLSCTPDYEAVKTTYNELESIFDSK